MSKREVLVNKFKVFAEATSDSVERHLSGMLDSNGGIGKKDSYYYINPRNEKTNQPEIILVAHIDTVDDDGGIPANEVECLVSGDRITNKNQQPVNNKYSHFSYYKQGNVLGADDRAGVVAILELYKKNDNVGLLFTHHEESGGIGVREFCADCADQVFLSNVKLFLELDRHGDNHFVDYNGNPSEVNNWCLKYFDKKEYGSFSDVSVIQKTLKIPAINVATGFFNEHTSNEYLSISKFMDSIERVDRICKEIDTLEQMEFIPSKRQNFGGHFQANEYYPDPVYLDDDNEVEYSSIESFIEETTENTLSPLDVFNIKKALLSNANFKELILDMTDSIQVSGNADLEFLVDMYLGK